MPDQAQTLLPCPFCGSPGLLEIEEDHHGEYYYLGCKSPLCLAHHVYYTESPKQTPVAVAIHRWNTRTEAAA